MKPSRRTIVLSALALCVPIPALALSGGDPAPETAGSLNVSASLASCGIAGSQVVCKIDASWNSVEGATSYSANVTSPDGAVVDYGDAGGSGTSFWVPYVGPGTYTVQVSAYGDPPGPDPREVIAKDSSGAADRGRLDPAEGSSLEAQIGDETTDESVEPTDGTEGEPPAEEPTPCEEQPPVEEPDPMSFDEDGDGQLSEEERAKFEAEAQLPEDIECPAPPAG